jgi:hypothetical protein
MVVSIRTLAGIRHLLGRAMDAGSPLLGALGGVEEAGTARVRMVVIRRFDPRLMTVAVSTDGRSGKVKQLQSHPRSELCIWLGEPRISLRLLTEWCIITVNTASKADQVVLEEFWRAHSAASQGLFLMPPPGGPYRRNGKCLLPKHPPKTFAMLCGRIVEIDALYIRSSGQERWMYGRSESGWRKRRVNP